MNNVFTLIKKYKLSLIAFSCFIIFLVLAITVLTKKALSLDVLGYNLLANYLISDNLTPIVKFITNFGGTIIIITITLLTIILAKKKSIKTLVLLNLVIVASLNAILKNIVQRPRPTGFRIIEEAGYSFPSGHSMVSMAFYGYFIYLIYKYVENKYLKWTLITLLSSLILIIGTSRIYLGVHYTSDVLAGFSFSIMYLIIFTSLTHNYLDKN